MKSRVFAIGALLGVMLALGLMSTSQAKSATAAGLPSFVALLKAGGLEAAPAGPLQHAGMSIGAQAIVVTKGGSSIQVELFDYADEGSMRRDWLVEAGKPVTSRSSSDFAGRVALWNANDILVFDAQTSSNDSLQRSVGQAFLSTNSANAVAPIGRPLQASAPMLNTVQPPHTGSAALLLTPPQRKLPLWAGLLWTGVTASAIVFAAVGGLVLLMKARRLA